MELKILRLDTRRLLSLAAPPLSIKRKQNNLTRAVKFEGEVGLLLGASTGGPHRRVFN